jgi:hypothetical protein
MTKQQAERWDAMNAEERDYRIRLECKAEVMAEFWELNPEWRPFNMKIGNPASAE